MVAQADREQLELASAAKEAEAAHAAIVARHTDEMAAAAAAVHFGADHAMAYIALLEHGSLID
jgi:hypothetical protein